MIKRLFPGLIEGGLFALQDSMRQDPRNIMYPDERTSKIYKTLRELISKAKQENINISVVKANYQIFLDKYRIAV